jgi:hypothetical protein
MYLEYHQLLIDRLRQRFLIEHDRAVKVEPSILVFVSYNRRAGHSAAGISFEAVQRSLLIEHRPTSTRPMSDENSAGASKQNSAAIEGADERQVKVHRLTPRVALGEWKIIGCKLAPIDASSGVIAST